jgi:hypothetical protein
MGLAFSSTACIRMLYIGDLNTMVLQDYCLVTDLNCNINVSWPCCTAHGSGLSLDLFMPVLLGPDLNISFTAFCNFFQFVQTANLLNILLPHHSILTLNFSILNTSHSLCFLTESFPCLCNYRIIILILASPSTLRWTDMEMCCLWWRSSSLLCDCGKSSPGGFLTYITDYLHRTSSLITVRKWYKITLLFKGGW